MVLNHQPCILYGSYLPTKGCQVVAMVSLWAVSIPLLPTQCSAFNPCLCLSGVPRRHRMRWSHLSSTEEVIIVIFHIFIAKFALKQPLCSQFGSNKTNNLGQIKTKMCRMACLPLSATIWGKISLWLPCISKRLCSNNLKRAKFG